MIIVERFDVINNESLVMYTVNNGTFTHPLEWMMDDIDWPTKKDLLYDLRYNPRISRARMGTKLTEEDLRNNYYMEEFMAQQHAAMPESNEYYGFN